MLKNNSTQRPQVCNSSTFNPPRSVYRSISSEDDPIYWRSISCSPLRQPNPSVHLKRRGDSCSDDPALLPLTGGRVNSGPVSTINSFAGATEKQHENCWGEVAERYYDNNIEKDAESENVCPYAFQQDVMISSPGWHPFAVGKQPSNSLDYMSYQTCHTSCPFQLHSSVQPPSDPHNLIEGDFPLQTDYQVESSGGTIHYTQQRPSPHTYSHSPFNNNLPQRRSSPPLPPERRSPLFAFSTGTKANSESPILCCFWDLESTGLSVRTDHIIQIGCTCRVYHNPPNNENSLSNKGHFSSVHGLNEEAHDFDVYVKTDLPIPDEIQKMTNITNELLENEGVELAQALEMWSCWLKTAQACLHAAEDCKSELWLIAHNGNQFDLPLLFHQELSRLRWTPGTFLKQIEVAAIVDSVVLSRALFSAEKEAALTAFNGARSHRLSDLYWDSFHEVIPNQHNALCDAKAVFLVMSREPFLSAWNQNLVAWKLSDYLQAFHRAFEKCREDPSGKRAAEMQINRYLADSVYNGTFRSRLDFESRQPVDYLLKPSSIMSLYPQINKEGFPSPVCATRPVSPLYNSVYFDPDEYIVLPASSIITRQLNAEQLTGDQKDFVDDHISSDIKLVDNDENRGCSTMLINDDLSRHYEDIVPRMSSQACRVWQAFRQKAKALNDHCPTPNRARVNQQNSDAASKKKSNNQELCISGKA